MIGMLACEEMDWPGTVGALGVVAAITAVVITWLRLKYKR